MTPAEIRVRAAEAIAHPHEAADKLAELGAFCYGRRGQVMSARDDEIRRIGLNWTFTSRKSRPASQL
jgi:hypothetical protein